MGKKVPYDNGKASLLPVKGDVNATAYKDILDNYICPKLLQQFPVPARLYNCVKKGL